MSRQLHLFDDDRPDLLTNLARFEEFGAPTIVTDVHGLPYFVNEFWTAKQRKAHRIHEVSYRACFKPQLPGFFIERLTAPGDAVYDPFMGRGTTPIEAALRGRIPYGNDTNPLSRALTEPRINPPTIGEVRQRLATIPWATFTGFERADLLAFYHPDTLAQIEGLRGWLLARETSGALDQVDRWIRMVALNRLTGHSAGFFSVYTLPPNQATSVERQRIINAKREQTPPVRDVPAIIARKSAALLADGPATAPSSLFLTGSAAQTSSIPDGAVALVVTSPPFLDIVNYEGDNWLRCWFIGVDPKAVRIAMHRTIPGWRSFVAGTLAELARVTRPEGYVAFEVGEVRKGTICLEEVVLSAAAGLPLTPMAVVVNQQEFTKTGNIWGISNNEGGTNTNRIVLFRRNQ